MYTSYNLQGRIYGYPHFAVRGVGQCGHFSDKGGRGILQMRTSTLFSKKTSDFSKFIVSPYGQGGWRLHYFVQKTLDFTDILRTRGGVNFSRFCTDVLYGWLLIKNKKAHKVGIVKTEDKRHKLLSALGIQQKWLRIGFEIMSTRTRDVLHQATPAPNVGVG